jgi:hypothetical protein
MSLRPLALLGAILLSTLAFAAAPRERPSWPPAMHADSDLDDDESDGSLEPAPDEEDGPSAPDVFTPRGPEPMDSPDTPESI